MNWVSIGRLLTVDGKSSSKNRKNTKTGLAIAMSQNDGMSVDHSSIAHMFETHLAKEK